MILSTTNVTCFTYLILVGFSYIVHIFSLYGVMSAWSANI